MHTCSYTGSTKVDHRQVQKFKTHPVFKGVIHFTRSWTTYGNMGVSGTPLGISGGEDSVNKNKGSNDLSSQSSALAVAICEFVGSASIPVVVCLLECLDQTTTADCSQALSHHVQQCPDEWHLASQKQPECHSRVDVSSCA